MSVSRIHRQTLAGNQFQSHSHRLFRQKQRHTGSPPHGFFGFGGGYAMISMIREKVLYNGWLAEAELLNMIAVAESTPGPIAVNMATFVGAAEGGVLGALVATLGVVLPSFCIILLIAALIRNFLRFAGVRAFLEGVRPAVVALIVATGVTLLLGTVFGISQPGVMPTPDLRALALLGVLVLIALLVRRVMKRRVSPIVMILISAGLGILFYGV